MKGIQAKKIRKIHRYLGLFLGIQFLMWTVSGMYFSWTDIDEIHGDQFLNTSYQPESYTNLFPLQQLEVEGGIQLVQLMDLGSYPGYWINHELLFNALSGVPQEGVNLNDATLIASERMDASLKVDTVQLLEEVGSHHEYRDRPLPAYAISFKGDRNVTAYVAQRNGRFESVRHRDWRWFDFLWMLHTMDYEARDDINNTVLRGFSLFGVFTVLSGFVLWFISSPRIRRWKKR